MTTLKEASAKHAAATDWKPATTKLEYRIEIINAVNPNRPAWTDGIGRYYVTDSRTDAPWEWTNNESDQKDHFWFKSLDFAQMLCDEINEFGHWRLPNDNRIPAQGLGDPVAARVVVYTEQVTRAVVYEGKPRLTEFQRKQAHMMLRMAQTVVGFDQLSDKMAREIVATALGARE